MPQPHGLMPTLSTFFGIIVQMFYEDIHRHSAPHVNVRYQGQRASVQILGGEVLAGEIPARQLKLVQAWMVIHADELLAAWELAQNHEPLPRIAPLR